MFNIVQFQIRLISRSVLLNSGIRSNHLSETIEQGAKLKCWLPCSTSYNGVIWKVIPSRIFTQRVSENCGAYFRGACFGILLKFLKVRFARPFRYTGNGTVSSSEIDDCLVCNAAYKTLLCEVTKGPTMQFVLLCSCVFSIVLCDKARLNSSPTSDHNIKQHFFQFLASPKPGHVAIQIICQFCGFLFQESNLN